MHLSKRKEYLNTVEVMILSRYRDSPSATVTELYQRYINFLNKTLSICSKGPILRSVTRVTLVTQVAVKLGNDQ